MPKAYTIRKEEDRGYKKPLSSFLTNKDSVMVEQS